MASPLGLCSTHRGTNFFLYFYAFQSISSRLKIFMSAKPEGAKQPSCLVGLVWRGTKDLARLVLNNCYLLYNAVRVCTKGRGHRSRSNGSGSAKQFLFLAYVFILKAIIMNFLKDRKVGIVYRSTKFELDQCINNEDLLLDRKHWKRTHKLKLIVILSPYTSTI